MNEHETNPQRPAAGPDEDQSRHTAELPRDANEPPQRGQSDPVAPGSDPVGEPAAAPAQPDGAPTTAPAYQGGQWQPGYQSGWSGTPGHGTPGQQPPYGQAQYGAQPQYGQPQYGQSQYGQQQHYGGQPQYGPQPQYAAQPADGQHQYGPQPGDTQHHRYGAQPGDDQQPPYGPQPAEAYQQPTMPPWAQPVGTRSQQRPARVGRILLLGVAALLLALSSGGVGAWTALALRDEQPVPASSNRPVSTGPVKVLERSSLAQIAAAVQDSVVSIKTGGGEGSGVVLSADGFVLTNHHVVANAQGGNVNVVFANGKSAQAKIVGTDARTDLAVVKADGVNGLSPAKLGDSASMQVGDTVLALGSPLGLQGSVTAGIISAKDRLIESGGDPRSAAGATSMSGLLQTDAPINPGNSGGALVNTNAEVIGINTAIFTAGQGQGNIGVGFAIPSNKAKQVSDQLVKGQKVSHPVLGVSVTPAEGGGAVVKTVNPSGPAAKAGLKVSDVITQVNGQPINDSDDLVGIVQAGKVGDQLQLTYTRNGAQQTATATLAEGS